MKVDVLIGADFYWSFVENTTIRGYHNDPIALKSKLGFLLSGPIFVKKVFENSETGSCVNTSHVMLIESSLSPESLVKESMTPVWGIGEFDDSNFEVIDRFRLTIKYNETQKQYSFRLPFKVDHHPICDNYDLCIKRFKSLQKKLSKNKALLQSYNDILKDQFSQDVIEPVIENAKVLGQVHYLPHRPVLREDKITSRIRIIFDASS